MFSWQLLFPVGLQILITKELIKHSSEFNHSANNKYQGQHCVGAKDAK